MIFILTVTQTSSERVHDEQRPSKVSMTFKGFVNFMIAEEDKTSEERCDGIKGSWLYPSAHTPFSCMYYPTTVFGTFSAFWM